MTILMIAYLIALVVLVFLSMIFSSADMAYGSVSVNRLEKKTNENPNSRNLKRAFKLSKNYDKTISAILLFNETINAGIDTISTLLGVEVAFNLLGVTSSAIADSYGLLFSMIFLILKIVIGEMLAKTLGKVLNYRAVNFYSLLITICYYVTWPITFVVSGFGNTFTYPLTKKGDIAFEDEVLHEMIDESEEEGLIDEDKAELLRGAVDFASTELYEVMTPRTKIYAIEKHRTVASLIADERLFNFSRIPVFEGDIDNIIGFIRTKYLIRLKLEGNTESIESIIENIGFFPRTKEINDVLKYFHETRKHIAVVLDEYGGTEGIITREDIIEEIVGEIWDETDVANEPIVETKDGSFIVDGLTNLEDFCDFFNIDFDDIETEYVTIGGFIVELLDDKFATLNEELTFKHLDMKIIALGRHNTAKKILVAPRNDEKEEDE